MLKCISKPDTVNKNGKKKTLRQLKELKKLKTKDNWHSTCHNITHVFISTLVRKKKKKAKAWYGYNSHRYCYMYMQNKHSGLLILIAIHHNSGNNKY